MQNSYCIILCRTPKEKTTGKKRDSGQITTPTKKQKENGPPTESAVDTPTKSTARKSPRKIL